MLLKLILEAWSPWICMGKVYLMEFQRVPLKLHTKYLTHTLKNKNFICYIEIWSALRFKSSYAFFETLPSENVHMHSMESIPMRDLLCTVWCQYQCMSCCMSFIGQKPQYPHMYCIESSELSSLWNQIVSDYLAVAQASEILLLLWQDINFYLLNVISREWNSLLYWKLCICC